MKIKIILVMALTIASMLALTSPVSADGSELDGKWAGTMSADDGNEFPLHFTFKVVGSNLTGSVLSTQGTLDIQDGKVAGDDITFSLDFGGAKVVFTGKLHNHVCEFDVDYQGTKRHITLKKLPDK